MPKISDSKEANEFKLSRVIDAPRELVFKAWTDPKQMAKWWGPHNFTNPICELDVRAGGAMYIVMRSPDGEDYPLLGTYIEIVEPERIVWIHNTSEHPAEWHAMLQKFYHGVGKPSLEARNMVTFEALPDGKTLLTLQTIFDTIELRNAMVEMGMNEGWGQSLEKLETLLHQNKNIY
jgi:uncharacterized protein YndB with AHSA1/START domain